MSAKTPHTAGRSLRPDPQWAACALLLYLGCALLLPALHLSRHDHLHEHLPQHLLNRLPKSLRLHPLGAAHLQDESNAAAHSHEVHTASPPAAHATLATPPPRPASFVLHGQGSLSHFAAAYAAASPPFSVSLNLLFSALPPPTSPCQVPPHACRFSPHSPRAPPSLLALRSLPCS